MTEFRTKKLAEDTRREKVLSYHSIPSVFLDHSFFSALFYLIHHWETLKANGGTNVLPYNTVHLSQALEPECLVYPEVRPPSATYQELITLVPMFA